MDKNLKQEKFKKLAENRVGNVIKNLRLIGNLANKSHYNYTDAQIKKIFTTLTKELEATKAKFKETSPEDNTLFKL